MFKTINPDYLSPVMLRLAEPIREQMTYTIIGDNDSISGESLIDSSTIDITFGEQTADTSVEPVYESGYTTTTTQSQTTQSQTTQSQTVPSTSNTDSLNNNTYYSY